MELAQLIEDEQSVTNAQMFQTWERPLQEKLKKGLTQGFKKLELGPDSGSLWAYPDESDSRFREGDLLCLHLGNALEPLCRGTTFEYEDDDRWLLRSKYAMTAFAEYDGGPCYVDPDTMDLREFYKIALKDIEDSATGRDIVLPLLCGDLEPTFEDSEMEYARQCALSDGFNEKQAEAVSWAHGAHHVACVQGPPGTGKTQVLALIARLAVERGERVLVTSHTHMGINNALNKIHKQAVPVVKVGRATQCKALDSAIANVSNLDSWEERPTNGYVVGATPFATCTSRLANYSFDTIIFDEASQITLPLAIMAMRKGRRYIFIGDQKQLPPVLLSRSVLDKQKHSVFSRLTTDEAEHFIMLDETYRMNHQLAAWPSVTFYDSKLRASGPNAGRSLKLTQVPAVWSEVLDSSASAVFIPSKNFEARTSNPLDAELIAELCSVLQTSGVPLEEIGIVTPFRAQGRMIRNRLKRRMGNHAVHQVVADTVERMQGQEREVVIFSLTSSDPVFIAAIAEFFFQPERLNVSATRAKTKLIIIGPEDVGAFELDNETLHHWVHNYKSLLAQCKKVIL